MNSSLTHQGAHHAANCRSPNAWLARLDGRRKTTVGSIQRLSGALRSMVAFHLDMMLVSKELTTQLLESQSKGTSLLARCLADLQQQVRSKEILVRSSSLMTRLTHLSLIQRNRLFIGMVENQGINGSRSKVVAHCQLPDALPAKIASRKKTIARLSRIPLAAQRKSRW